MEKMTIEQKQLVMDNLKLVHYVIHTNFSSYLIGGCEYEELEQEGYIALCKAAMNYDNKSSKFSTYAVSWIWGYIKRYLDTKTGWAIHSRSHDNSHYEHINYDSLNRKVIEGNGTIHELFEIVPDKTRTYDEVILLNDVLSAFKEVNCTYGEDIFRLLNDGFTQQYIANHLKISQSYVSRLIKKAKYIYDSSI